MQFAEVKRENKQRDGCAQIVPFARKGARQSRESANARSNGQVRSFNVRRANHIGIGVAEPRFFDSALQFGRRVSRWAFSHSSVNLNQLRIIDSRSETQANSVRISGHAVTGQLKAASGRLVQLFDKDFGINASATAKMPSQDCFAVAFDGKERPRIALSFVVRVALIPFFATNKSPKLVNLYVSHGYFAEVFKHNLLALLASDFQDFQDSSDMHVTEPCGTANATTFCQAVENAIESGVRDVKSLNRLHATFRERAAALTASKAWRSILSVIAVRLRGIDVTSWTIHSDRSSFLTRFTVGTSMRLIGLGSHLQCESGYDLLGCYKQSNKSINGLAAGEGFEPSEPEGSADLQSAPIGHSGNPPLIQTSSSILFLLRTWKPKTALRPFHKSFLETGRLNTFGHCFADVIGKSASEYLRSQPRIALLPVSGLNFDNLILLFQAVKREIKRSKEVLIRAYIKTDLLKTLANLYGRKGVSFRSFQDHSDRVSKSGFLHGASESLVVAGNRELDNLLRQARNLGLTKGKLLLGVCLMLQRSFQFRIALNQKLVKVSI